MANGRGMLSGRTLAAFAGGSVAAVVASRILPPIISQAFTTARGADPFEALIRDHRHVEDLLNKMEATDAEQTVRRTQLLLRLKRAITEHALAEEDMVYPLLRDMSADDHDVRTLYSEHADIKMHLHTLERLPKDDPRWMLTLRSLKDVVLRHVDHEERVDFPALRAGLSEAECAKLAGRVRREKSMVL